MANDWIETTLGEIAQNISRPFNFDDCEDVIFVNTGDVLEGRFLHSNTVSKIGLPGQAKKKIEKGDILFSEIRPANKRFALVDFDPINYVVSTKFMVIKQISKDIDSRFFYILLTNQINLNEFQMVAESRSGTFPQITFDAISYFPFKLPPLPEQKAIAHILGSLDDKIELNRQMNQTLEAMAQALFKSWFVDFDPVIDNALAAGKPIPDELSERAEQRKAVQHGDNQAVRALFPDEFELTEQMGWIPKGWKNGTLADISSYGKGKVNTSELTLENYISTENMNKEKSGICHAASIASTSEVPKFSVGQTLISNIRPYFKKIWLASFSGGRSNDVLALQAKNSETNEYLFNLLYQDSFFDYMSATSKGTKMPRGDKAAIMNWLVVIPSPILMEEFSKKVKPMYLANQLRSIQAMPLTNLRDTLLPKLLSGELRIPDAAAMVEDI